MVAARRREGRWFSDEERKQAALVLMLLALNTYDAALFDRTGL